MICVPQEPRQTGCNRHFMDPLKLGGGRVPYRDPESQYGRQADTESLGLQLLGRVVREVLGGDPCCCHGYWQVEGDLSRLVAKSHIVS